MKGSIGEQRVRDWLATHGFVVSDVSGPVWRVDVVDKRYFCVDLMAFGGGQTFLIQVKHKDPTIHTRNPLTGLERVKWNELIVRNRDAGVGMALIFTDSHEGKACHTCEGRHFNDIYGEWVSRLLTTPKASNDFPNSNGGPLTMWHRSDLRDVHHLFKLGERQPEQIGMAL